MPLQDDFKKMLGDMQNPWGAYARKYGLNTEDLQGILSNLENLKANVGFVPEYFRDIPVENLMDSTSWPPQMVPNPNAPSGILPSQKMMKNPDVGKIPANRAFIESEIVSNTLSEPEYLNWVEENFPEMWGNEEQKKAFFDRRFPDPNNPYRRGTDPNDPFYEERSFSPHPSSQVVQDYIDTPVLQYLAAQGNPELDLDNPNQKFFPKKGYPEVPLQFLRDYIASGAGVSEDVPRGAAGVYWGNADNNLYDIGILPEYYDQPDALANIFGHEGGHGAVEAGLGSDVGPYGFWQDAPYPWAYLKKGEEYDVMKSIYPEMGLPSKHFASPHKLHPAFHTIDETFFGGYGQPKTSMDRVNPVNDEQAANAMYIINRTMKDENNARLANWDLSQSSEEFFTPSTRGPVGMGSYPSERTSFGLTGPAGSNLRPNPKKAVGPPGYNYNTGGIATLML